MKAAIFLVLPLVLIACTTNEQDAANACGGIRNTHSRQVCVANYLSNAQLQQNAEWDTVGTMLYRPARTTCMNIGGIVTCQ